jgi:hypothetical protein
MTPEAYSPNRPVSARNPLRTTGIVLASVALGALALILSGLLIVVIATSGEGSIAVLFPLAAYATTGWFWALLALAAIVLGVLSKRPAVPVTLGAIALVGSAPAFLLYLG